MKSDWIESEPNHLNGKNPKDHKDLSSSYSLFLLVFHCFFSCIFSFSIDMVRKRCFSVGSASYLLLAIFRIIGEEQRKKLVVGCRSKKILSNKFPGCFGKQRRPVSNLPKPWGKNRLWLPRAKSNRPTRPVNPKRQNIRIGYDAYLFNRLCRFKSSPYRFN